MLEGAISTPALEEVPKGRPRSTWFEPSLTRKAPAVDNLGELGCGSTSPTSIHCGFSKVPPQQGGNCVAIHQNNPDEQSNTYHQVRRMMAQKAIKHDETRCVDQPQARPQPKFSSKAVAIEFGAHQAPHCAESLDEVSHKRYAALNVGGSAVESRTPRRSFLPTTTSFAQAAKLSICAVLKSHRVLDHIHSLNNTGARKTTSSTSANSILEVRGSRRFQ